MGDFPPAEIMRRQQERERDPLEQEVTFIVKNFPVIKTIDSGHV